MEFLNLLAQPHNFFSTWHTRTVRQQQADLYAGENGSPYSNYLFPWLEGITNPARTGQTAPPHLNHLATNFPRAEQTRSQNQAPPPKRPRKGRKPRMPRRGQRRRKNLMRHRR